MKTNQPESHSDKTVEFRTGNVRAVLAVVYLSLLLAACGSVPVEPRSPAKVTIVETTTVVEKGTALTREKPEIEAQGRSTAPVTDTKLCECWHESLESVLASASWYESLIFGQEGDGATCFTRCTCPSSPLLPEGGTMGSSESWVVVGEWGLYKGTVNSEDRVFTLLSPDSKLVFMEERDSLVFQDGVLMNRYEVIASGTDRKCS